MKVSMIGPLPAHWGGGTKWRGGGVSSHIQGLLGALASYRIEIQLLADNVADGELPRKDLPINIQVQPITKSLWRLLHLDPRLLLQLAIVFTNDEIRGSIPWPQLVRFLGLALNYKHFITSIPTDILHVQHILHRPYICRTILQLDLPLIVTVQSVNYLVEPDDTWHTDLAYRNYRTADRFIAVSHYVKEMMIQHGADGKKIVVIPNGVDIDMFAPGAMEAARRELGLPLDSFIVLFTGNLVPRKGIDVLLKAFEKSSHAYPNSMLLILGDGYDREKLTKLAQELGVANQVQFAGFRMLPEMPLWYRACDVFVMPSWAEGLSLSILEAMAAAKPVITSFPTVGKHDAVEPGKSGWLTKYGEVDELAAVLEESMNQPQLTNRMGKKARQAAEAQFSWQSIGERTMNIYREVLAEGGNGNRLSSF